MNLPETLPLDGKGFTKRIAIHLNYGPKGGWASYTIHDANGVELPISYFYDTRKPPTRGFSIQGELGTDGQHRVFASWREVVEAWPAARERLAK